MYKVDHKTWYFEANQCYTQLFTMALNTNKDMKERKPFLNIFFLKLSCSVFFAEIFFRGSNFFAAGYFRDFSINREIRENFQCAKKNRCTVLSRHGSVLVAILALQHTPYFWLSRYRIDSYFFIFQAKTTLFKTTSSEVQVLQPKGVSLLPPTDSAWLALSDSGRVCIARPPPSK